MFNIINKYHNFYNILQKFVKKNKNFFKEMEFTKESSSAVALF